MHGQQNMKISGVHSYMTDKVYTATVGIASFFYKFLPLFPKCS